MRFLYSIVLYFLTPFVLLRFWWKGRHFPAYRRMKERFCLQKSSSFEPVDIWVHAVSLGEVMAATPLVEALLAKKYTLLLTTTTATGSARVEQVFGSRVSHQFLPYDLPVVVRRFFNFYQPKLGFIMETELWPNLIYEGYAAKVPLILGNARLSERSYNGYRHVRGLMKPLLQRFKAILPQSQEDAKRFSALGAYENTVHVLGNLKFDLALSKYKDDFFAFQQYWGEDRVILIAASTHEQEEELLLSQLQALQEKIPSLLFLIAPRHPERFKAVYELALQQGFHTGLRTNLSSLEPANEVVVLDSLGELLAWFQLSDYAFVGGSFVPVGGHNVLEPIAMKVPVLTGPYVHNFKAICRSLEKAQALVVVDEPKDLVEAIYRLHAKPLAREKMVERAQEFLEKNKGALSRYVEKIGEWM